MKTTTVLKTTNLLLIAATAALHVGIAAAAYPERPIRFVVPYPPGGATDIISRSLAQKMSDILHHQVVIDNRGGGGQVIGTETVAKAPADGYTIMLPSVTHAINPSLVAKLPYDTVRDFASVSMVAESSSVLAVHPSVPGNSLKELLAWVKANPGKISYASSGNGSGGHLLMELFQSMAGTQLIHVPYKGAGPALNDVVGGQVPIIITSPLAVIPLSKAGRLKILAITSKAREPWLPDVPTVAEAGVPGYEGRMWYGVLVPRGTPRPVINTLNDAIRKSLAMPDLRERYAVSGGEAVSSTPEELDRHIKAEMDKWHKVIVNARIHSD